MKILKGPGRILVEEKLTRDARDLVSGDVMLGYMGANPNGRLFCNRRVAEVDIDRFNDGTPYLVVSFDDGQRVSMSMFDKVIVRTVVEVVDTEAIG